VQATWRRWPMGGCDHERRSRVGQCLPTVWQIAMVIIGASAFPEAARVALLRKGSLRKYFIK
jgi:hypothetical protein